MPKVMLVSKQLAIEIKQAEAVAHVSQLFDVQLTMVPWMPEEYYGFTDEVGNLYVLPLPGNLVEGK